jgi:hypothetical protein
MTPRCGRGYSPGRASARDCCFIPLGCPAILLWIRPPYPDRAWSYQTFELPESDGPGRRSPQGMPLTNNEGRSESNGPRFLFRLFTSLLPAALARQSFFHTLLLAGFQIKGVPLDLLDNIFLLHLTLKAPECVFEGLALLQSDFCQRKNTPKPVLCGQSFIARFSSQVKGYVRQGIREPTLFAQKVILNANCTWRGG